MDGEVKIKEEKIDLEIEEKINVLSRRIKKETEDNNKQLERSQAASVNYISNELSSELGKTSEKSNSSDSNPSTTDVAENKDLIEPIKSSNELLAELFKVFNAAPPEKLLSDENLLNKSRHKKRKKGKKKKHKQSKSKDSGNDSEESGTRKQNNDENKYKHNKKKKHKHKDKKEKSGRKSKDKSLETVKEKNNLIEDNAVLQVKTEAEDRNSTGIKRKRSSDENSKLSKVSRKESTRKNDFYNGFEEDGKHNLKVSNESIVKTEVVDANHTTTYYAENKVEYGNISDISLSDEETYLKERVRITETGKKNIGRTHNSFYAGIKHSSSRSRSRSRDKRRYLDRRYATRTRRHHSRSRSRSRDLGIDKKRLLEIARKNAISMFKRGNMPGCANMPEEIKDKVLLKMRYGGRTVQDLTEFCKKISNGENLLDLSSDEASDVDKSGNTKVFHHPFLLKEREPIVMHIRNSNVHIVQRKPIEEQTKAITMQFPVSSGQQHRLTEGWVPVETKEKLNPLPTLPMATQSTNIFKTATDKTVSKNVFEKSIPQTEQEPAFKPVGLTQFSPSTSQMQETVSPINVNSPPPYNPTVPPPITSNCKNNSPAINEQQPPSPPPTPFVPDVPLPSTATPCDSVSVFPQVETTLDVSTIISKRLNAMRRLQENPMDSEAIKMMYSSQKEMSTWASSKHLPGQFTGSTGVNVLKAHELNSGPQLWARRDQLTATKPVTGGMGMQLLQKMGWKPGEGLGREKTGSLQPLLLDVKLDKRGLVSKEDNGFRQAQQGQQQQQQLQQSYKKQRVNTVAQAQQNVQNKHPVCLLNELTSKRKWTPPLYTVTNEIGPSHSKMFLFSVSINGQTFTPDKGSNTKKEAKLLAARHCLQQMGILPVQ